MVYQKYHFAFKLCSIFQKKRIIIVGCDIVLFIANTCQICLHQQILVKSDRNTCNYPYLIKKKMNTKYTNNGKVDMLCYFYRSNNNKAYK